MRHPEFLIRTSVQTFTAGFCPSPEWSLFMMYSCTSSAALAVSRVPPRRNKKKVGSPSQPLALTSGRHRATMEETGRNVRGMLPKLHISTVEVAEDKSERPRRSRSSVRVSLISVARITATVKSEFSAIERLSAIMCGINENRVTGK